METLKDRIYKKRAEASHRTFNNQRENADLVKVDALREDVKILTRHQNYLEAQSKMQDATMDILVEEVSALDDHVNMIAKGLHNLSERLVRDEELIGIDDESEHCLGQDLTMMSIIDHYEDVEMRLDQKLDDLHTMMTHENESLQNQINKNPEL